MIRVLQGDCRVRLAEVPAGSAHVCVTSPPFYGLRNYGTEPVEWLDGWRGELGGEPTPDSYLAHLVEVFGAVRRVLRPEATLWVNLGDSYNAGRNGGHAGGKASGFQTVDDRYPGRSGANVPDLPPGSLLNIPHRFALAMQAAGWVLRSSIVLVKRAPMPESVQGVRWERCRVKVQASRGAKPEHAHTKAQEGVSGPHGARNGAEFASQAEWQDCPGCPKCLPNDGLVLRWGSGRPTSAYEMLFVFSQGGAYYWDSEAIRRAPAPATESRDKYARAHPRGWHTDAVPINGGSAHDGIIRESSGGNALNWIEWEPAPLSDAHYAAFPPFLPALAIRAGTSERGVCGACGAPWARVVERETRHVAYPDGRSVADEGKWDREKRANGRTSGNVGVKAGPVVDSRTTAWRPTCTCPPSDPAPAVVLDPFGGAGTTGLVADRLGRDAILCELNPQYAEMAAGRVTRDAGLFAEVETR